MVMYAAIILAALIIAITLKYVTRKKRIIKGKPIPRHPGPPVIGMGLEINESNSIYKFEEMAKRYGEIFSLNVFGQNMVVLNSEPIMRNAFCSEKYAKYFNDKPKSFYGKYFRHGGDSVGVIQDARENLYKKLKKTFMKALHTYGTGIKNLEDKVMIEMENILKKIDNMKTKEFEFVGFIKRSLSNVMSLVLVGKSIPDGDPDENLFWQKAEAVDFFVTHYVECLLSLFPTLRLLPFTKVGQMFRFGMIINRRTADKYFHSVWKERHDRDNEGIVNFYLEQQRKQKILGKDIFLTDNRIIAQTFETIEAGIITTWSVLTNSMLILLNHPECQTKIHEEIDRVMGRGRLPTFSDRAECPYIMAFEKEVHRYAPVAPLLSPHWCNEDIEFEGYSIEKNSMIVANTWFVHHDEKIWGDPWNFRPERFLDEHGELLPTEHLYCQSVIPFGIGDRRCPGEMFAKTRYFLYIATLLQHYRFETPEGATQRSCDPRSVEDFDIKLTLRAKPFMVRAVQR